MPLKPSKDQRAYLYDRLESAQKAVGYVQGVTYDEFWQNSEKRDAVAMRIAAIGEAARQITPVTEAAVPSVPFHLIRGMRNRIAHHCRARRGNLVANQHRGRSRLQSAFNRHRSRQPDGQPGLVVAVQTFGDFLFWHPHVHVMAAAGVLMTPGGSFGQTGFELGLPTRRGRATRPVCVQRTGRRSGVKFHLAGLTGSAPEVCSARDGLEQEFPPSANSAPILAGGRREFRQPHPARPLKIQFPTNNYLAGAMEARPFAGVVPSSGEARAETFPLTVGIIDRNCPYFLLGVPTPPDNIIGTHLALNKLRIF